MHQIIKLTFLMLIFYTTGFVNTIDASELITPDDPFDLNELRPESLAEIPSEQDLEMNFALEEAQTFLPNFLLLTKSLFYRNRVAGIQVAIRTTDNNFEDIWVEPFKQHSKNYFSGTVSDDPTHIGNLKMGQEINFTRDQIRDWFFVHKGRAYGYFTLRALSKSLPEEEAREIDILLHKEAIPSNW